MPVLAASEWLASAKVASNSPLRLSLRIPGVAGESEPKYRLPSLSQESSPSPLATSVGASVVSTGIRCGEPDTALLADICGGFPAVPDCDQQLKQRSTGIKALRNKIVINHNPFLFWGVGFVGVGKFAKTTSYAWVHLFGTKTTLGNRTDEPPSRSLLNEVLTRFPRRL